MLVSRFGEIEVPDDDVDSGGIERIESEVEDREISLPTFEILTYPADYTLEVLVDKYTRGQIQIPSFQRKFVWSQVQASKLIESFLLGLPVPAIFLYTEPSTNRLLVVDGQQRLKAVAYFMEGYFGEEQNERRPVFRLKGLDANSPFLGRTYSELKQADEPTYLRLNDAVLRAFVIKQLDPADNTSIYHVFERLNTGGTFLTAQEIRNCVRHGPFNDALIRFNGYPAWRRIFGSDQPERRMRDVELILRFLALSTAASLYEKPMKDFLNRVMDRERFADEARLAAFEQLFRGTCDAVNQHLGARPFHLRAGLNAAAFDAVFTTIGEGLSAIPGDLPQRYDLLKADPEFRELTSSATTDKETVIRRLRLARDRLLGWR